MSNGASKIATTTRQKLKAIVNRPTVTRMARRLSTRTSSSAIWVSAPNTRMANYLIGAVTSLASVSRSSCARSMSRTAVSMAVRAGASIAGDCEIVVSSAR